MRTGVPAVKAKLRPKGSQESEPLRGTERTCMRNLLATTEERVYFKDERSRFLLVSAGWIAAITPDRRLLRRGARRSCL
jgi:hypothetical protein